MDVGFSRRGRKQSRKQLDQLNYMSLLAELAAAQADSATAQAQSQLPSHIGTTGTNAESAEKRSFHPATAALLSGGQE